MKDLSSFNRPSDENKNFAKNLHYLQLKVNDIFCFLPSDKVENNKYFFKYLQENIVELKNEKEGDFEKFFNLFFDDLFSENNRDNIGTVVQKFFNQNVSYQFIHSISERLKKNQLERASVRQLEKNKFYNLMEIEENKEAIYSSGKYPPTFSFRFYKPKVRYKSLVNYIFPKVFFSKVSQQMSCSPKVMDDLMKRFERRNKGFLKLVDIFFSSDKKISFTMDFFIEKQKNTQAICKETLEKDLNPESHRFLLLKLNESLIYSNEKAIFLQKHIRTYLKRSELMKLYAEKLKLLISQNTVLIQKNFRKFLATKKSKTLYLLKKIRAFIKSSKEKISSLINSHHIQIKLKTLLLQEKIFMMKNSALDKIQKGARRFLNRKEIKKIIQFEKTCIKLVYPFKAKSVRIKIFLHDYEPRIYDFYYCKIQETFVLYIEPKGFERKSYKVQFLIDNVLTCDGRYPHIEFVDGLYYNIIDFTQFELPLPKKLTMSSNSSKSSSFRSLEDVEKLSINSADIERKKTIDAEK